MTSGGAGGVGRSSANAHEWKLFFFDSSPRLTRSPEDGACGAADESAGAPSAMLLLLFCCAEPFLFDDSVSIDAADCDIRSGDFDAGLSVFETLLLRGFCCCCCVP